MGSTSSEMVKYYPQERVQAQVKLPTPALQAVKSFVRNAEEDVVVVADKHLLGSFKARIQMRELPFWHPHRSVLFSDKLTSVY